MVEVTISIEDELAEALQLLAKRNHITQEALIKRVLEQHIIEVYQADDPSAGLLELDELDLVDTFERFLDGSIMIV